MAKARKTDGVAFFLMRPVTGKTRVHSRSHGALMTASKIFCSIRSGGSTTFKSLILVFETTLTFLLILILRNFVELDIVWMCLEEIKHYV